MKPSTPSGLRHRYSLRLQGYDYSQSGLFFITIVTYGRASIFGKIVDGEMRLNQFGKIVQEEWERTSIVRPTIKLDAFEVMPNHFHGILRLEDHPVSGRTTRRNVSTIMAPGRVASTEAMLTESFDSNEDHPSIVGATRPNSNVQDVTSRVAPTTTLQSGSLGAIVGQFKSNVTKRIRLLCEDDSFSIWQRNYYEHILHDQADYERIAGYILENPSNWYADDENPDKSS
jgi:putative transposase